MTITDREARLLAALRHAVLRTHEMRPRDCDACLDVAAWVAIPGYDGQRAHPLLRIGEEAVP